MANMRHFNAKILCFVVGALNGLAYLITGVLIFFYYYSKMKNEKFYYKEILLPAFIGKIFGFVAFVLSLVFLKGVYQKRSGLMAPFLYVTSGYIIFAVISLRCIYNADLVRQEHFVHGVLRHLYSCLGLGLYILFVSPMFLMYKRMRKTSISSDHHIDDIDYNVRPIYPSLY
ncbi:uncharacterized protein LOC142241876 [Haematobia irritans]|uniref:uncharacterized protein LOC142241876 n=1 Tax=Haematobia irritans TaxID=7368 RepID=UPI003F505F6D